MQDITLQALLEAGCHFGHKAERWHPKASEFIYTEKDGIHIIDLAKTKAGLEAAAEYIRSVTAGGGEVLFVGTKRQAQGILKQEAENAGAPYFSERWIGGFLTNWDQIRKNIEKINRMEEEQKTGAWKKFPKHEQVKMSRYLERIKVYYGGVLKLNQVPQALFIIDVKKEIAAVREAIRRGVRIVGVVDTNSSPVGIDYVIPANDDAVGSVTFIMHVLAQAYQEGKDMRAKEAAAAPKQEASPAPEAVSQKPQEAAVSADKKEKIAAVGADVKPEQKPADAAKKPESVPTDAKTVADKKVAKGKRGRPKKVVS